MPHVSVPLTRSARGRSSSSGRSHSTNCGQSLDKLALQSSPRQVISSAYSRLYRTGEDPPTGPLPSPSRSPSKERRFLKRLAQEILEGHFVKPRARARLIQPALAIPAISTPLTMKYAQLSVDIKARSGGTTPSPSLEPSKTLLTRSMSLCPGMVRCRGHLSTPKRTYLGASWAAQRRRMAWGVRAPVHAMAFEASQIQFDDKHYTHRGDFSATNVGTTAD
ncbi:hypothetical protein NP233_g2988 [Leucocoprinus birnbaumii]|uniref:Uncharacterized protein n=1 Tax=Leucocoprinus birnbaumii TaxID=56174 RepID=A0AAD5YT76_9AGAR|nr:hypothetical protein NP233_g2988 [Leucocoprinus birnbaumii]